MSSNNCAVCWKKDGMPCNVCRSCYYCSNNCQSNDRESHKLLCHAMSTEGARPSPLHVRAIYFPEDKPTPELIWVFQSDAEASTDPGILSDSFLRQLLLKNEEGELGSNRITWNYRLKQYSPQAIEFHFRQDFSNDGSQVTASLNKAVEPHGTERRKWRGPLLVMAVSIEKPDLDNDTDIHLKYTDVTLADFRGIIDHSLGYEGLPSSDIDFYPGGKKPYTPVTGNGEISDRPREGLLEDSSDEEVLKRIPFATADGLPPPPAEGH